MVSRKVIGQIINNSRRISVAEASQLAVLFQTDEDFWINLQAAHDRWESRNIIANNQLRPIQIYCGGRLMINYVEIARSWRLQNPEHADSGIVLI